MTTTRSITTLLAIAGLTAAVSAQTSVAVNANQVLSGADLLAGEFQGNAFTLGEDTIFEINTAGAIEPIKPDDAGPIDFAGSTIQLNSGGRIRSDFATPSGAINARIQITNGIVERFFRASSGTAIEMTSGVIERDLALTDGAQLRIAGGQAGNFISGLSGSAITLDLGSIGDELRVAGAGSTLSVNGGFLGDAFTIGSGATFTVTAGTVGNNGVIEQSATMRVTGGTVGSGLDLNGSLDISGGQFGNNIQARQGSSIMMSGGAINGFTQLFDATMTLTGGSVGSQLQILDGSTVTMSGGSVGEALLVDGGTFRMSGGSVSEGIVVTETGRVELFGTRFFLDGAELGDLVVGEAFEITDREVTLLAQLADGNFVEFDLTTQPGFGTDRFFDGSVITVTRVVPAPTTLAVLAGMGLAGVRRRRG